MKKKDAALHQSRKRGSPFTRIQQVFGAHLGCATWIRVLLTLMVLGVFLWSASQNRQSLSPSVQDSPSKIPPTAIVNPTVSPTIQAPTVTKTLTTTPTVTATPETLVPGTILFEEDFEDGLPRDFTEMAGNWTVMEEDTGNSNKVLDGDNRAEPHGPLTFSFGSAEWTDYAVVFDMKLRNPIANVFMTLRNNPRGYYVYWLNLQYSGMAIEVSVPHGAWTPLTNRTYYFERGVWYHVRLEAQGQTLRIFIDDELRIEATDSQLDSGDVGFGVFAPSRVQLDNIRVTVLTPDEP